MIVVDGWPEPTRETFIDGRRVEMTTKEWLMAGLGVDAHGNRVEPECADRPDVDDEMLAHHAYDIDGRGQCGLCGATG